MSPGMADLSSFAIGVYSWGDPHLMCRDCCWTADLPDDLAAAVALAEGHRCQRVVDGELGSPAIGSATRPDLVGQPPLG